MATGNFAAGLCNGGDFTIGVFAVVDGGGPTGLGAVIFGNATWLMFVGGIGVDHFPCVGSHFACHAFTVGPAFGSTSPVVTLRLCSVTSSIFSTG